MSHEINRVLSTAANGVWAIDTGKAQQIAAMLALRADGEPSAGFEPRPRQTALRETLATEDGTVHVLRVHGTIFPRANILSEFSGGVSLVQFQQAFQQAAQDTSASAIILDVDSPGGMVDFVPETAAMIRAARNGERPIVAVANPIAASAAYWLASQADELLTTPSGAVGSIGVYMMHEDISAALEMQGVKPTFIFDGIRKVERNNAEPLSKEARGAMQEEVSDIFSRFVADVATARGVDESVVRADPESADASFGGGRAVLAERAVSAGLADGIATLAEVMQRFAGSGRQRNASMQMRRRRLQVI